jgi:3-methylcrotonyl-CoA carboxylase alpha subunit
MNGDGYQDLLFRLGDETVTLRARIGAGDEIDLLLPTGTVRARATETADGMVLHVDGVRHRLRVVRRGAELVVIHAGRNHVLHCIDPLAPPSLDHAGDGRLTAPIPARVARILVRPGDRVAKGAPLLVLEAMKMEITLSAPTEGTIATIRPAVDDMVEEGMELVTFAT